MAFCLVSFRVILENILATAYLEQQVTNERLQSILNKHSVDVGKKLAVLIEKNMLIAEKNDVGQSIP